jgi:hypothetical protein
MRWVLGIVCVLVAARVDAAPITLGSAPSIPPNTIHIVPEFVDVTKPSQWRVKSPTGPNPIDGWHDLFYTNSNPNISPPHWVLMDFYVDRTEAAFHWKPLPTFPDFAKVDVSEFVAAGDASVVLRIDSTRNDFENITWQSPNLGVVTREYFRTPEPASAALLALGALLLRRRRRRS